MSSATIVAGDRFKREETNKELVISITNENGNPINPDPVHQGAAIERR